MSYVRGAGSFVVLIAVSLVMLRGDRGHAQEIRQSSSGADSSSGTTQIVFEQSNVPGAAPGQAQEYYFKKILENEIAFLKMQLQEKEKENVQLLEKKQSEYQHLMEQQRALYEEKMKGMKQSAGQEQSAAQQEIKKMQAELAREKAQRQASEEAAAAARAPRRGSEQPEISGPANERLEKVMAERHQEQVAWALQRKNYENELAELRAAFQQQADDSLMQRLAAQEEEIQSLRQRQEELAARPPAEETAALHRRVAELEQQLAAERQSHANALRAQRASFEQKMAQVSGDEKPDSDLLAKEYEARLAAKYQQFEQVVREKDQAHAAALESARQELERTRTQSDEREKSLRRLLAEKELAAMQQKDQEVARLTRERDELRQASEQMKIYLNKLKDELNIKTSMIVQKDEYITTLNRKVSFLENVTGEARETDAGPPTGREETTLLKAQAEELRATLAQTKRRYEATIDQQKQTALQAQKEQEIALANNDAAWERKLQLEQTKYRDQLKDLEQGRERQAAEMETKLREVADRLRARVKEDEEARQRVNMFRASQMTLLEDMLASKVALVSSLDAEFRSAAARGYFEQGLAALKEKRYATARQQLQQALSLETQNNVVKNMLESVEFLLERKD